MFFDGESQPFKYFLMEPGTKRPADDVVRVRGTESNFLRRFLYLLGFDLRTPCQFSSV